MAALGRSQVDYVIRVASGSKVQAKTISIRGGDDAFDRYKMRQLAIQVVGKGKMIRTNLVNVDDVAKDLKTDAQYIGAYFGYELGASSKYDAKRPERERASVSGDQDPLTLTAHMRGFISKVLLCPNCDLPELTLNVEAKSQTVNGVCSSCGHRCVLNNLNPKFQKYVCAHPPTVQNTRKIEAAQKKKMGEDGDGSDGDGSDGDSGDDGGGADSAAAAASAGGARKAGGKKGSKKDEGQVASAELEAAADAAERAKAARKAAAAAKGGNDSDDGSGADGDDDSMSGGGGDDDGDDDDDDWGDDVDTSAAAVAARQSKLMAGGAVAKMINESAGGSSAPAAAKEGHSGKYSKEIVQLRKIAGQRQPKNTLNYIKTLRSSLTTEGLGEVLFCAFFTADNVAKAAVVNDAVPSIAPFTLANQAVQLSFLKSFEHLCSGHPACVSKSPAVLKAFYDADVITEDGFVQWYSGPASTEASKALRTALKPMADWLKDAEEA